MRRGCIWLILFLSVPFCLLSGLTYDEFSGHRAEREKIARQREEWKEEKAAMENRFADERRALNKQYVDASARIYGQRIQRNKPGQKYPFFLIKYWGEPVTNLPANLIACLISQDGSEFRRLIKMPEYEVGHGSYMIEFEQSETNAKVLILRCYCINDATITPFQSIITPY